MAKETVSSVQVTTQSCAARTTKSQTTKGAVPAGASLARRMGKKDEHRLIGGSSSFFMFLLCVQHFALLLDFFVLQKLIIRDALVDQAIWSNFDNPVGHGLHELMVMRNE
ncbi:hypothetical protein ACVLD2_000583 [Paenibacillus sp. PvR052]